MFTRPQGDPEPEVAARTTDARPALASRPGAVLALQRSAGNAAVAAWMKGRRTGPGDRFGPGVAEPRDGELAAVLSRCAATRRIARDPSSATEPPPAGSQQQDAEEEPVWVIEYEGQTYAGTEAELAELRLQLIRILAADAGFAVRNRATLVIDRYYDLQRLNDEQYIVSFFVGLLGGGTLDESFFESWMPAVEAMEAAFAGDDLQAAVDAVHHGAQAVAEGELHLAEYMDRLEIGAKRTETAIDVTATAALAVCSVALGAKLVTIGVKAVWAGAAAGGLTGLAGSAANNAPKVMLGSEPIGDAALKVLFDTGMNTLGAGLAARILPGVSAKLTDRIIAQLRTRLPADKIAAAGGEYAIRAWIKEAVEPGLGNVIQGVFGDVRGMCSGATTWEQFFEHVAVNLIAGGIAGRVLGRIKARQDAKLLTDAMDEARVMDDIDQALAVPRPAVAPGPPGAKGQTRTLEILEQRQGPP
jgi:hypothetical protein